MRGYKIDTYGWWWKTGTTITVRFYGTLGYIYHSGWCRVGAGNTDWFECHYRY